jgi:hypothetical protein
MAVDIVIQETIDLVDITVNPNIIEVNVTRTSGGGGITPNLQQVTDVGNITSKSIIIDNDNIFPAKSFKVNNTTSGGYGELNSDVVLILSPSGTTSTFANGGLTLGDLNQDITNTVNFSVINDTINYGVGFILNSSAILQDISLIYHPDYFIPQTAFNGPVNFYIPYKPEGVYTLATLDDIPAAGVTSVGLTMPSAFTVTNSPITSSGDIAVTGAGAVSQYVRGDGTLANFSTSSGGGSSLSFYLNGSVSQGTFGGVTFKEMDRTPILGAGTDFTINANGYIQSFITDAGVPNQLEIPAGNWNFETYFSASSGGGSPSFYVELYKWDGATLSLIASNSATPENITGGTSIDLYVSALAVPQTALLATDRLAVRIYVTHSGRTITLHTEDNHLCQVITTFSTGLTALNGLTAQVQNLAVGTTGTDFAINSTTATHTFNLPTASALNRGALSSTDWTTFNSKGSGTVTSVAALTLGTTGTDLSSSVATGTTTPVITLNVPTASATNRGALSSTDWSRFDAIDFTRKLITSVSTGSVTGTTAETIISSMLVPANTLDAICDLFITFDYNKNSANPISIKLYYNTTNSLSGATQISLYTTGSFRNGGFNRKFVVKGTSMDLITAVPTVSLLNNQFTDQIFGASTVITIAPTSAIYFIFTVANDAVGTTFTNKRTTVEKMKLT